MNISLLSNISLLPYNTFRVNARAKNFVTITDEKQLPQLYAEGAFERRFFTLGGGSNVLFTKDFDGTIVHVAINGIQHFIEGNYVYVTASGGEVWNDLVWYCVDRNFPGMENMALIPGTVGASPVQNIGAYGTELMDIFYTCRAFDTQTGRFETFGNADCGFSYRDSIFKSTYKGRFIIASVTYKLYLNAKPNTSYGAIETELKNQGIAKPGIKDIAEAVSKIRVDKLPDPSTIGNAGSFFKNPIIHKEKHSILLQKYPGLVYYVLDERQYKIAAGWLIEQCGWKGKKVGNVLVWPRQALVITNAGSATGQEIFQVSEQILADVRQEFDIELEREVNIL